MNIKIFVIIAGSTSGIFILSAILDSVFGWDQQITDPQIKTAASIFYFKDGFFE